MDECCIVLYDDAWTKNTRCVDLFFSKLQSQLLSDGHGSSVSLTSYRLKTLNNGVARGKQSGSKAWCVGTCGNYLDYTEQLTTFKEQYLAFPTRRSHKHECRTTTSGSLRGL